MPGPPDRGAPTLLALMLDPRLAIAASLAGVTVLCWLYLFAEAADMRAMGDMTMAMPPKGALDLVLLLAMWWIMMVGMMLPSAAPMILTFATINARRRARARPWTPTALFAAGYVLAWGGFSAVATLAQWGLESAALVSPMAMAVTTTWLGGLLFVAAGLYQLTPLKRACLSACRSPFDFVVNHWRDGAAGALGMGLSHGLYCLGCCWVLMTLLFVFGAMNLLWVAVLAAVVLVEKLLPFGEWTARVGGLLLAFYGLWLLVAGWGTDRSTPRGRRPGAGCLGRKATSARRRPCRHPERPAVGPLRGGVAGVPRPGRAWALDRCRPGYMNVWIGK